MLVSDVVNRVRTLAGDTSALQFKDNDIVSWVNDGVRECAVTNNLLQKSGLQNTVIGQVGYVIPEDMLKLHSVKCNGVKLREITQSQFDDSYATSMSTPTSPGRVEVCYVWAGKLNLYPAPDSVVSLRIDYLYEPVAITSDGAGLGTTVPLPVGYHSRIVDYCLAQVFLQDGDSNGYSVKMQEFRTGVSELKDQPESTYDEYPSMSTSSRDMGAGYLDYQSNF